MSEKIYEDNSMERLVKAFRDAHFGASQCRGIPYVPSETAQSYLFRVIDFMNPEIWDDASTNAISKEVILVLFQCAARLYQGSVYAKEAVELIKSEDTLAILSLGIQDGLSQVIHQQCVESIRSNKSEATNAENHIQQAGLFSAIRKNEARQINQQAMIVEHISSLCRIHSVTLQNTFESPMVDERFMFTNYITLSESLNLCEKSWLVTLLPNIFQWDTQNSCGDTELSNTGLLKAGLHAATPNVPEAEQDSANISDEIQDRINIIAYKDIQEAFNFMDSSCPPLFMTDKDVQHWLGKSTPQEINEMWKICCNWRTRHQHPDSKLATSANSVIKYEKWREDLQKRAITYRNSASAEAITTVLNAAKESRDELIYQRAKTMPSNRKFEKGDLCDSNTMLIYGPISPTDDISDLDLNNVESDDDNESIFQFSPDIYDDDFGDKSESILLLHDTNMLSKTHCGCSISAEGDRTAFAVMGSSNAFVKAVGKGDENCSKRPELLDPARGHKRASKLGIIPEETHEQLELEEN